MVIVLFNMFYLFGALHANRLFDKELKALSPTFERRKIDEHSDAYYKLNRIAIIISSIALCSSFVSFVAEGLSLPQTVQSVFQIIGCLFFIEMPIKVVCMFATGRKAKKWLRLSRNKLKLTNKERRELEAAIHRSNQ